MILGFSNVDFLSIHLYALGHIETDNRKRKQNIKLEARVYSLGIDLNYLCNQGWPNKVLLSVVNGTDVSICDPLCENQPYARGA